MCVLQHGRATNGNTLKATGYSVSQKGSISKSSLARGRTSCSSPLIPHKQEIDIIKWMKGTGYPHLPLTCDLPPGRHVCLCDVETLTARLGFVPVSVVIHTVFKQLV